MFEAQKEDIDTWVAKMLAARNKPLRVDVGSLTGNLRALVEQFQKRAESVVRRANAFLPTGRRCDAQITFCEAPGYGAFAMPGQYDFIVLNIGLVPTLTDFFQRMMATAGLWPGFGEQDSLSKSEPFTVPDGFRAHMLWNVLPARAPSDMLRIALATVFMSECFDFIVRHELAHLVLGHLREDTRSIRADPLAVHALEFFADGHAAIWGLEPLRDMPRKIDRISGPLNDAYREFHRSPDDAFTNYLLVIFLVLRLMDETDWIERTIASKSHPPAPMRFNGVCIHFVEHFKQIGDSDGEARVLRTMQHIWELGERIFAATLGIEPNPDIKLLTLSELGEEHYERMSDKTRSLPPHLFDLGRDQPAS
jgi:hypothetical protein